ncbi:MarR family winged helix-turn-helix transcriptional regulator [Thetidibacter halocola]|uniref:MarR family transcriptional regulator n=1 Tax=Thetidibacter halocola TaxID=2827239 RepID=A0A8J7WHB1_9RHOB|nr:MarR family transcriptional regulator [Thetidibacter halocola]MBS0126822.1 MarR family transcriptional regulator [Thetidibacter halocola]
MTDLPDSVDYGPLSESLGFLLRLSQLRAFADFFDGMAGLDVHPGELSVLLVLSANPGIRQGVLARALTIKRAHMTKMVRAMERDGLVSRTVPQDDRRAVELWLTDTGHARVAALRPAFDTQQPRETARLTPDETTTLKRLLRKHIGLKEPDTPCP